MKNTKLSRDSSKKITDAYFFSARDFLLGAKELSTNNNFMRSCALLAAQALENTLKALISHKIQQSGKSHDLLGLWNTVSSNKIIEIPSDPPVWVTILSKGHGPNFFFRYQEGEEKSIADGFSYPPLIKMTDELATIMVLGAVLIFPELEHEKIKKWLAAEYSKETFLETILL